MIPALLTAFAAASLFVLFRAQKQGFRSLVYAAKPLALVSIALIAATAWPVVSERYRTLVLVGFGFSLLGDVLLMLPRDRFLAGLAAFLVAHLAFIGAFLDRLENLVLLPFLPYLLAMVMVLRLLWRPAGHVRIPILLYGAAITAMAGLALGVAVSSGGVSAWLGALGAALFVLSDAALAFDRFVGKLDPNGYIVLGTYFTAQWLIALSVAA